MRRLALVLALALAPLAAGAAATHLLVVTGLPGEPAYAELFEQRARSLLDSAHGRLGIAPGRTTWLAGHVTGEPAADGTASREAVIAAVDALASDSAAGDRVVIVLIGHGTARDGRALFNLPGPDLSPADLAAPLERLAGRRVALIDTAPASAPFLTALAAPGRVLISATGSAAEDRHTLFADPFIAAFAGDEADADKDGRVSLLEAFAYANHEVERRYEAERRLRTEHALLEDDGDGRGSDRPGASGADGAVARGFHLAETATARAPGAPYAELLEVEARELMAEIEALRRARVALATEVYEQRLETLLVRLAVNRLALRAEPAP